MNMLLLLALAAVRVHAKLVEKTLTARDRQVLEKAKLIDKWFEERRQHPRREIVGRVRSAAKRASDPYVPPTWTVSKEEDLPKPWQEVSGTNHAKQVFRATLHNKSVIIKRKHHDPRGHDLGGMTIYKELLYLEALRGEPGVPELYGAWFDHAHATYVVQDCGSMIGRGAGSAADPTRLSAAFVTRAETHPLHLARSLLACFQSWASAGFVQDDFYAPQFTLDDGGAIFLVDGPDDFLLSSPLGNSVVRAWGTRNDSEPCYLNRMVLRDVSGGKCAPQACEEDRDCPWTRESHSCRGAGSCESKSRGAPEARGKCFEHECMRLSEKTHVYDVANRPWLLPFIADHASQDRDRLFLRSIIRKAGAGDPESRPSFAEFVDAIDAFIRRPTNVEESPKERLYASPLIQSNERRKAAFWEYASVVVLGEGVVVSNLCDDRGLACYEGEELPAPADLTLLRHKDRHRRDHDPSEADKRDPGALDVVYGRFRFDEDLLQRAVPAPSFSILLVADAWAVVQRTYDGSLEPDAFLERRFPRGVQSMVMSLAGRPQNGTLTQSDCDRAVRHLAAFSLVADDTAAVMTVLYGLYDVEAPAAPPPSKTSLRVSAAAKARVLDASWCHARVVAAARALPTFSSPS